MTEGDSPRRRPIQREHIAQKHCKMWCREAIAAPHLFLAFDRSKAGSQWAHLREKMRGVTAATPDTLLRVKGLAPIWAEWKAPGLRPTPEQFAMGQALQALGDFWLWTVSVIDYYRSLKAICVPMHPNAEFLALHHDAGVASEIARAELAAGKAPKSYKPRARAPTAGQVRRAAKAGAWG